jgi:hypothetical protein
MHRHSAYLLPAVAVLLLGLASPAAAQDKTATPPPQPDGFRVGGFTFRPGGRIKLDIIRDFRPIGNEDAFDTRTIPVDGSEGTNSNVHAKESRLNLDVRGQYEGREVRMFVEGDFYGTGSAFRLRHAYGSYGGLLAGQTWSTFVDEDNFPGTIDFESPTAFASIRQAQLRWTQKLAPAVTWYAAVEDNKSTIVPPDDRPGKAEYPMPDFVTKFRYDVPKGHVSAAAFLGAARFRPAEGDTDTVSLWGSMVSARFTTVGRDSIYGVFTFGEGIGRYRGGNAAIADDLGQLQPVGINAYMGGYEHYWTDRLSSNAVYSDGEGWDQAYYDESVNKQLTYAAVNVLYWFIPGRAWSGVEYLYGRREVYGSEGLDGTAHRVQFAVRFNLP